MTLFEIVGPIRMHSYRNGNDLDCKHPVLGSIESSDGAYLGIPNLGRFPCPSVNASCDAILIPPHQNHSARLPRTGIAVVNFISDSVTVDWMSITPGSLSTVLNTKFWYQSIDGASTLISMSRSPKIE